MAPKIQEIQKQKTRAEQSVERTRDRAVFVPRTDIYEEDDSMVLELDMPGVNSESVDINVDQRELTITGCVDFKPVEGHDLSYAEFETGDYQRSFIIPDEIDVGKIDASLKNGVLCIRMPKSEEAKPRKIAVKTA